MGIFQTGSIDIGEGALVYVCGPTGGGKTTFLKRMQKVLGARAGMVMQNPDSQIVNDRVYSELAFGVANQGKNNDEVRSRIAETAAYFGISRWLGRDTASLSGGEKQLLSIASVMAMAPEVLLLDEPTAMLDPVTADRVLDLVRSMNRELGITVVVAEHRPDRFFADADLIIWVDGENIQAKKPDAMAEYLADSGEKMLFLPAVARFFKDKRPLPLTLKEAKNLAGGCGAERTARADCAGRGKPVLEIRGLTFGYEKNMPPTISNLNLSVRAGEILSVSGENGSGKTTFARLAAGSLKPYSGTVRILGKKVCRPGQDCAMLFQDVTCHFTSDECTGRYKGRHPYDLSGGEQQLAALETVLACKPALLILDEPTKGLDPLEKEKLAARLCKMRDGGMAILIITHDIEFSAKTADRMALLFAGEIACDGTPEEFCKKNIFFTTVQARIFRRKI